MAKNKDTDTMEPESDSMLDIDFADVPEMTVLDADTEVEVAVARYQQGTSRKSEKFTIFYFEVVGDPTIKTFSNYYGFGGPEDNEKQRNEKLNRFMDFAAACDVDTSQSVDLEQFIGAHFWAVLGQKEDATYGVQNTLKRIIGSR